MSASAIGSVGAFLDPERSGELEGNDIRVGDRREQDPVHAVRKRVDEVGGDLQPQPSLPGSARARRRDHPRVLAKEERLDGLELLVAAEEGRRLGGKVRGAALERPRRGKSTGIPAMQSWCRRCGRLQVLEPVLSEVAEGEPAELGGEQVACRLGEENLAAVGRRRHPRCSMHVDADVTIGGHGRLPGVEPDSDTNDRIIGPVVRGER